MPPESENNLRLEIGHVLFIDIVGYSKLLIEEQKERLNQLTEIVLATAPVREAADEQLVRLPTGDGMALVFHHSAEEPARCALEIAEALQKHPELPVRMGIHSGPVNEVKDVSGRSNIAGAGINLAQRVMDCGDAGHILLSQRVADDLGQYRQWSPRLHDLGDCEVKHGVRLHVLSLYTEEAGNSAIPEKFKKRRKSKPRLAASSRRVTPPKSRWPLTLAAVLFAAVLVLAFLLFGHRPQATSRVVSTPAASPSLTAAAREIPKVPEKSIAVLPFENRSEEKANAFFADGVQDEILTDLAKVADLKVISRTSVMKYRQATGRNLRQIGQELGVAHLLEGSVQRSGGRVRVNAQLIDARTDAHLWAQTYDRDLADVFAIQSEIAKAIAGQLQAKLSPSEKARIDRKPTSDLAAFELYTRGKALVDEASNSSSGKGDLLRAVDFFTQAVHRDAAFLVAYCQLVLAHDQLYLLGYDHSPDRLDLAQAALHEATKLAPDSGETHLAAAWHLYARLEYSQARGELAAARKTLPNNARAYELSGYINRRQGRWTESVRDLEQALELDPSNVFVLQQLAHSYESLPAYPAVARTLDRVLVLTPDDFNAKLDRAQLEVTWRADTKPLHALIEARIKEDPAAAKKLASTWVFLAMCERDLAGLENALIALGDNTYGPDAVHHSRTFGEGVLARMKGDAATAQARFSADRIAQKRIVEAQPDYGPAISVLGVIDASLGRKDDALREGHRGVELLPVARDSINGPRMIYNLALIAAWTGETDLAIEQLRIVTQLPSGVPYGVLKLHPMWDPLRGDPRFKEIVVSLAPKDATSPGQ